MGCTIEMQSGGAESPPPPPPPPPGQADQPAADPANPEQPKKPANKLRLKGLRTALGGGGGAGDKKEEPATDQGTIKVQVVDGDCDIKIDGESLGTSNAAEKKVSAGKHEVSCLPAGGKEQTHAVEVVVNETTTVAFSLQAGTSAIVPKQ